MLVMIGAFPPPVRGMPVVNAAMRGRLDSIGADPLVIDLVAPDIQMSFSARMKRFCNVVAGAFTFLRRARSGGTLYLSVSGGFGKVYDIFFVAMARLRRMRIFLHHHSFAYLRQSRWLAKMLVSVAGKGACHIVQSPGMGVRLQTLYDARQVVAVSNAVFLPGLDPKSRAPRTKLRTIGFISNLTAEKGVFDFLDLMREARLRGLPLAGILAGPFQCADTEAEVRSRLGALNGVEYIGPVHGSDKAAFFERMDLLAFPTRYANETEGIVNLEAMQFASPVIAFGRGCIPEIVSGGAGKVIPPEGDFVAGALDQIQTWLDDPLEFEHASKSAADRCIDLYRQSDERLRELLRDIAGLASESPVPPETVKRA